MSNPFIVPEQPEKSYLTDAELAVFERGWIKTSKSRVMLSQSTDAWEGEVYEELIKQHPWMARLTVKSQLTQVSEEGAGVGYFVVMSKQVPAAAIGSEGIPTVTVPIIIRDFRLFPLDVYGYRQKYYPISEERVIRTLRVRDIFTETDRREFRQSIRSDSAIQEGLTARDRIRGSHSGLPSKFSEAQVRECVQQGVSVDSWRRIPENLEALQKFPASPVETFVQSRTKESGAFWELTDERCTRTPIYESDERGRTVIGETVEVPLSIADTKLSSVDYDLLLQNRWLVTSLRSPSDVEKRSFEVRDPEPEEEWVSVKESAADSGSLVVVRGGGKVPFEGRGVVICSPGSGECGGGSPLGVLTAKGLITDTYDFIMLPAVAGNVVALTDLHSWRSEQRGGFAVLWEENGKIVGKALHGVSAIGSAVKTDDGLAIYSKRCNGELDVFLLAPGVQQSFQYVKGTQRVTCVPDSAILVPTYHRCDEEYPESERMFLPETLLGLPTTPPEILTRDYGSRIDVPKGVEDVIAGASASVDYAPGDTFRITLSSDSRLPNSPFLEHNLLEKQACAYLVLSGASSAAAQEALKVAREEGSFLLHFNPVEADVTLRAADKVAEKLSSVKNDPALAEHSQRAWEAATELRKMKLSAAGAERSVDAVLQLGFLSPQNLLKFVDLLPDFEEALASLTALLVASRLGLEEVPEESCEAAVQSLEPVIRGLRSIEYALVH